MTIKTTFEGSNDHLFHRAYRKCILFKAMLERYRDTPLKAMVGRSMIRCPKLSLSGEGTSQAMIDNCNSSLFDSLIKTLLNWSRGPAGALKAIFGRYWGASSFV